MHLFCYACNGSSDVESTDERLCQHCGSDFVEIQTPRGAGAQRQEFDTSQRATSAPGPQHDAPSMPGDEDPGMRFAEMMLQHMMGPRGPPTAFVGGNRSMVFTVNAGGGMHGVHFGAPFGGGLGGGLSLGDFAMGNNIEQIMAQLAAQHEPLPQPTSRDVLKSMPHVKVTSAAASAESDPVAAAPGGVAPVAKAGEACTICHDEFTDGMEVTQLPGCGHCFHRDCITPWLEQHNTCPVCRHALPVDEELQRQAQQRRAAQLRQPMQPSDGPQQHVPGAHQQTIADFANTLLAQLSLAQGQQGAGMIAIPVVHIAGASPHDRRPTSDGRPVRIVRARTSHDQRTDEVRSRAQPADSASQPQAGAGQAAESASDLRSDAAGDESDGRSGPFCRLQ